MIKQLILIRHAHRDTSSREMDNGLSPKGDRQAKWLKRFAARRFNIEETAELGAIILSSPKRRCQQTVAPIAEYLGLDVKIRPELDEQKTGESFPQFNERLQEFMNWWVKDAPPVVFACSHGDWLPLAVFHVCGTTLEMKKGGWLELEWEVGRAELRWYLPSFKAFYADGSER